MRDEQPSRKGIRIYKGILMNNTNELPDIIVLPTEENPLGMGSYVLVEGVYMFKPSGEYLTSFDLGNLMEGLNALNIGDGDER